METKEILEKLSNMISKIDELEIPDEITLENKEKFQQIIKVLTDCYDDFLRIKRALGRDCERSIKFKLYQIGSQQDDGFSIFSGMVQVRTVLQSTNYPYPDARTIAYIASSVTRSKATLNNISAGLRELAEEVKKASVSISPKF